MLSSSPQHDDKGLSLQQNETFIIINKDKASVVTQLLMKIGLIIPVEVF